MLRQMLIVLATIACGAVAVNLFVAPSMPPAPTETLGQRADRECTQPNKDDRAWCRDQILLRHALRR